MGRLGVGKTRVLKLLQARLDSGKINNVVLPDRGIMIRPVIAAVFNPWLANVNLLNWVEALSGSLIQAVENAGITVDRKALQKQIDEANASYRQAKLWNNVKASARILAGLMGRSADSLKDTELDYAEHDRNAWRATVKHLKDGLKGKPKPRLLVIIDDLDRCNAELIRAILDTSFNSLIEGDVTFLVATDRHSVVSSLAELLPGKSENAANKYLEKLVPIDFVMPRPTRSQIEKYVSCLMEGAKRAERQLSYVVELSQLLDGYDEAQAVYLKATQYLAQLEPIQRAALLFNSRLDSIIRGSRNPRRIKRMLTRYLRIVEVWNIQCHRGLDGMGRKSGAGSISAENRRANFNTFHSHNVTLLCAAINIAFIKESHPEFYNEILSDPLRGEIAVKIVVHSLRTGNDDLAFKKKLNSSEPNGYASTFERMNELGLGSDKELMAFLEILASCEVPYDLALNLARLG